MEAKNNAQEMEKAELIAAFYYTQALLQSKAITYIANGETDEVKILRLKDVITILENAGVEIIADEPPPVDCGSCDWDRNLQMCKCTLEQSLAAAI